MSLYQKHRPTTFEEVKGNDVIISALQGLLKDIESCPHAFLFFGDSGCGKTTIARILAKELGCAEEDLNEIDNASFRGIDSVREIQQQCMYKPAYGRCRVYILDEIHKMTGDAQNALLKLLEDTPKHVYFMLCTTDPQKLLATIKNRCQQFQVKKLDDETMRRLLKRIATKEKKSIAVEALNQIVQDSMGCSREAITTLEKTLAVDEDIQLETARHAAEAQSQGIELCRLLMKDKINWNEVAAVLKGLKDQEPEGIRRLIISYCSSVLLNGSNARCGLILECMMSPNFTNGFPELVYHCYEIYNNSK